jgi:radical SAM superfamily enzyme YgiQ (UPF0313 family)
VCKLTGAKYPAAPLGLMTAAALLPQQWQFKLIDANVELLLDEQFEWADIVCTGGMLPQQRGMLSIIDKAHQNGCRVVVGGPDPTSQPELYQSADYLVQGEGEINIPRLIEDLDKGCLSGEYKSCDMADMTKAVVPRFDLVKFKDYIHVGIQYTRGCPFNCEFCDIIELYGRKSRTKTSEQIINELQTLYDLGYKGHIDFVDDNFIGNKKNVKKVLPAIKEWSDVHNYPFYFTTEATINLADDEDLLQMMKDIDFRFVFIGIESPENEVLTSIQKKLNTNRNIVKNIMKIYSYGMIVNAGFIIGFDNENNRSAENMMNCIQESGICMAMLGKLYALPKTQLTRRLKMENRLFEDGFMISEDNTKIDQTTSGLNFKTIRPRIEILTDYLYILRYIYNPERYYERIIHTSLKLIPANKYKPGFVRQMKMVIVFFRVCIKVGFSRITGLLYWKMLFTILIKNPKAIEAAVNLAAMYIHFHKQSKYIIEHTLKEINYIKNLGEMSYNNSKLLKSINHKFLHK